MDIYATGTLRYSDLKETTSDTLIEYLKPFRENKKELEADKKNLKYKVRASSEEIRKRAQNTLREVKELTGLLNI
jgi:tryptophanyl-tRNA synthetase